MRAAVLSLALMAALWAATRSPEGLGAGALGILVLVLAAPLTLVGAYAAAIRRARMLVALDSGGWAHRALAGPVLRLVLSFAGALALAAVALFRLVAQGWPDWAVLALTAACVPAAAAVWRRLADPQVAPGYRLAARLRAGRLAGSGLGLAAYAGLLWLGPDAASPPPPPGPYRSVLVEQVTLASGQWRALEDFALGHLSSLGDWGRVAAVAAVLAGNAALVWTASGLAAAAMLPRAAWPVAIARAGTAAPTPRALGWSTAIVTLLTFFVFAPALALAEWTLRAIPPENRPARVFVTEVEEIGGQYFAPGTIAALTGLRLQAQAALAPAATARLQAAVDAGFDRMADNVDPFLDWYYSLPAEYARIGHLLLGDFESYLGDRIGEYLTEGDPFAGLAAELDAIEAAHSAAMAELESDLARLAGARRMVLDPDQPVAVTGRAEAPGLLTFSGPDLAGPAGSRLRTRLAVAGGGAGLAAAMSAAVMAKIGAKGVSKLAAKALAKVALSKSAGGAAGAGAGSVVGGILGSAVPGLGTALGAALGGAIGGAALGIGADALLLELEETLHRDDLAAAIRGALAEARAEAHALIGDKSTQY